MTLPNPKNTGKQTMPDGKSEIPADIILMVKQACADLWSTKPEFVDDDSIVFTLLSNVAMTERQRVQELLKDPAAVRINYLRGDIACQVLIDEAVIAERERCAQLADDEADKLKLRDGPHKRRDPLNKQIVAMKVVCRDIASAIRNRPSSTEER